MPRTETLVNLRTRAQQEANMVNSNLVSTSEWNTWANSEYLALYEMLVAAGTNISETSVNITVGTDIVSGVYTLPADFLGLVLLSRQLNTQRWVTLREALTREIDRFPVQMSWASHYRLSNNTLVFYPQPQAAGQVYRLIYVPTPTALSADGDTVNGVNGWEEYIVVGMAIRALQKIESDATPLVQRKAELTARIQKMIDLRNLSEARRVYNASEDGWFLDGASFWPIHGVR